MLKRKEECDSCLQTSLPLREPGEKKIQSFQPTLCSADESSILYFIFSLGSLRCTDVYRRESGRCRSIPFILTFFIINKNVSYFIGRYNSLSHFQSEQKVRELSSDEGNNFSLLILLEAHMYILNLKLNFIQCIYPLYMTIQFRNLAP